MTKRTVAERALSELLAWSGGNEPDTYPYFKDLFCEVFGYPKNKVRINESGNAGFPDLSLYPEGTGPSSTQAWVVCEVKPEKGHFRDERNRVHVWETQLKRYVTSDTVYAILLDPTTIAVLFPDGKSCGDPILLEAATVESLRDPTAPANIAYLAYESSVGTAALKRFIQGTAPSRYLDVRTDEGQASFGVALRISARELQDYAFGRVEEHFSKFAEYETALAELRAKSMGATPRLAQQEEKLKGDYGASIGLREALLNFEATMGREPKKSPEEQAAFVRRVYSTEAANLVLARILFVRFFEDYGMVNRKISNGGIRAFRDFHSHIKDDYRFLLDAAFRDLEAVYARLFEKSVFDWAHEGDGELSRVLLRVFFRLNAYDFTQITGDILGNLYERFLDPKSRKELGEFYTPEFVVNHILSGVGFTENPAPILDPACGSGTFLYRSIEVAIERFRAKGVAYPEAIEEAVKLVHGIDVNIFAAFIAQLQVIWHLFPHLRTAGVKSIPHLNIYGGLDSLDSSKVRSFEEAIILPRELAAREIREGSYRYVVGNPPYIRAERMKSGDRWESFYPTAAEGKKDAAFYFLQRAIAGGTHGIDPWLEPEGRMGFIVPFGVADSKAGVTLRKTLLDNGLTGLTDLETVSNEVFTSGIATSRSTVAPIIVFAKRGHGLKTGYPVRVTVATRDRCIVGGRVDLAKASSSLIPSTVFFDETTNPFLHFATKLIDRDLEVLEVLFEAKKALRDYAAVTSPKAKRVAIQVGIQTGTGGKVYSQPGPGRLPMAKGQHVHTFALNGSAISEYASPAAAQTESIWGYSNLVGQPAYAVSEICYAPQFCRVDTAKYVVQKTCTIFVPRKDVSDFPWDIYLNSSVVRLVFLLMFRSGLLEGDVLWRSHVNADAVKALPVPKTLIAAGGTLLPYAPKLRELAASILSRWDRIREDITGAAKVSLATLDVHFENIDDFEDFKKSDLRLEVVHGKTRLQPYVRGVRAFQWMEGDPDLMALLNYLTREPFDIIPEPGAKIPMTWKELGVRIREAEVESNPEVKEFRALFEEVDRKVSLACGLTKGQASYVEERLRTLPLASAQPRWPWTPAMLRATKTYTDDRFE